MVVDEESEVRRFTMIIVRQLLNYGLKAGESPYVAGDFVPWSLQETDQVIQRIETAWDELGHEPNIWDLVWFGKAKQA